MLIKNILITGISGTIGTRLAEKLLDKGYKVQGVDWRKNKWSKAVEKITFHYDLRDKAIFKKLPHNFDLIIHLAANARVYNLVLDPSQARDNFETTFKTLDFARQNKIKNFIFASSRETYGNSGKIKYQEKDADLLNCESPYTASKMAGEALVYAYHRCYLMDYIVFRFSNVYGMYDTSDRAVPLFMRLAKAGQPITIFGKDKLLDFTYIDDCVGGIIQAIEKFNRTKNQTYNLAYGQGQSVLMLAKMIRTICQSKSRIIIKPTRTGEVMKFVADIKKAKQTFGYCPKVSLSQGLKKSLEWYS